jgi:hypothetical protein
MMETSAVAAVDPCRLDKAQFLSLLSFFRLQSIEAVLIAAAHHVRCDDFDTAAALYRDLVQALRAQLPADVSRSTSDDRLRFSPLVASLSSTDASAWLSLIEQNQRDLLVLQAPLTDPPPSINPALASSLPSVHDVAVEDGDRGAGSSQRRTRQQSRKKRTAENISQPLASSAPHDKKNKLRRTRARSSSAKREAQASAAEVEEVKAGEEESVQRVDEKPIVQREGERDEEEEQVGVLVDGTEVQEEEDEVDEGGSGAASSSTVSRWQRPRKRLVRFRLNEGEDEQQQLQAMEVQYWKEMSQSLTMISSTDDPAPSPSLSPPPPPAVSDD